MSDDYNESGNKWLRLAGGVSIVGIIMLTIIMIFTEIFTGDNLILAVRNMGILSVIVATIMYIIKTMMKVALSSFHLSRDAKEREQLSYFYLALSKEKLVSESERELVLSALFSRSDTGLLKGDSSPELPSVTKSFDFSKNNK